MDRDPNARHLRHPRVYVAMSMVTVLLAVTASVVWFSRGQQAAGVMFALLAVAWVIQYVVRNRDMKPPLIPPDQAPLTQAVRRRLQRSNDQ